MRETIYSFTGLKTPCSNSELKAYLYEMINNVYSDLYPDTGEENKEYFVLKVTENVSENGVIDNIKGYIFDSMLKAEEWIHQYEYKKGISVEMFVINNRYICPIKHKEYFEEIFNTYPGYDVKDYIENDMLNGLFIARSFWNLGGSISILRQ